MGRTRSHGNAHPRAESHDLVFTVWVPLPRQVPQGVEDVAVYGPVGHRDHEEPEGRHGSARVVLRVQEGRHQSAQHPRM